LPIRQKSKPAGPAPTTAVLSIPRRVLAFRRRTREPSSGAGSADESSRVRRPVRRLFRSALQMRDRNDEHCVPDNIEQNSIRERREQVPSGLPLVNRERVTLVPNDLYPYSSCARAKKGTIGRRAGSKDLSKQQKTADADGGFTSHPHRIH